MKMCYSCLLILALAILSGCMSMSGYREASLQHHAYASGEIPATAAEWRALVLAFQKLIDTDTQGSSADDAQYAIGSCWVWSIKTGDPEAPQQAIDAFHELIRTYPTSPYVPLAHYWLGRCYDAVGDDYQAIMQYQIVENRYVDAEVSAAAQLELARVYARQGYVRRAETFYGNLINSSSNQDIATAAAEELQLLKHQQKTGAAPVVDAPTENRAQAQQKQKPAPPTPDTKALAPESLTREFGLTAKTIVIDPGHGGTDPGALGNDTLQEKAIVLSISEKLREVLISKGYTVLMTRDTNRFIPLKERTEFAMQHKADLFLSIHANASENLEVEGIETYYLDVTSTDKASEQIAARENADSGYSIQELETLLKGLIQESKSEDSRRLAEHVQQTLVNTTGAADRGVKHARFVVLIGTNVPAILIETGFVSSPTEAQKLATPVYQRKLATAIAKGVDKFLGKTGETPLAKTQHPKLAAKSIERNR